MLYIRMFIILIVSLFTVRLLLQILGQLDYGIYNVVGSIVSLLSFISYTLFSATQRYFSMALAQNDKEKLNNYFNIFFRLYLILGIILAILIEITGIWFFSRHINVPPDRLLSAKIVFQFANLAFVFTILAVPFQALIIANEKMKIFAYISIFEALLKLCIVLLLYIIPYNKLITYSLLYATSCLMITLIYFYISLRLFNYCRFKKYWDAKIVKEITGYAGWNIFGSLAASLNIHGINLVINMFFGPFLNAARGLAVQINTVVNQFVTNFTTAVNPQIIKLYAIEEREKMQNLVYQSSKYSFFLILILSIPLLFETDFFLNIWLKTVPEYTVLFVRLIIINTIIDTLSYPFQTAVQATGKVRYYQFVVGSFFLLNVPITFSLYNLGLPVETCFYVSIGISLICLFLRLYMLKKLIKFSPLKSFYHPAVKQSMTSLRFG